MFNPLCCVLVPGWHWAPGVSWGWSSRAGLRRSRLGRWDLPWGLGGGLWGEAGGRTHCQVPQRPGMVVWQGREQGVLLGDGLPSSGLGIKHPFVCVYYGFTGFFPPYIAKQIQKCKEHLYNTCSPPGMSLMFRLSLPYTTNHQNLF